LVLDTVAVPGQCLVDAPTVENELYTLDTTAIIGVEIASNYWISNFILLICYLFLLARVE
jgi:hypothetical protein